MTSSTGGAADGNGPPQSAPAEVNGPGNMQPAAASTSKTAPTPAAPPTQQQRRRHKAVVVGGGWAGFGAALALAKSGAEVTLLDASENPGGLSSSFTTPGGQMVEPGIKGFWYQVCVYVLLSWFDSNADPALQLQCTEGWAVCICRRQQQTAWQQQHWRIRLNIFREMSLAMTAVCWCVAPLQYANIEALVRELGIPSPFTPFTRSSFWTPDGLQVSRSVGA